MGVSVPNPVNIKYDAFILRSNLSSLNWFRLLLWANGAYQKKTVVLYIEKAAADGRLFSIKASSAPGLAVCWGFSSCFNLRDLGQNSFHHQGSIRHNVPDSLRQDFHLRIDSENRIFQNITGCMQKLQQLFGWPLQLARVCILLLKFLCKTLLTVANTLDLCNWVVSRFRKRTYIRPLEVHDTTATFESKSSCCEDTLHNPYVLQFPFACFKRFPLNDGFPDCLQVTSWPGVWQLRAFLQEHCHCRSRGQQHEKLRLQTSVSRSNWAVEAAVKCNIKSSDPKKINMYEMRELFVPKCHQLTIKCQQTRLPDKCWFEMTYYMKKFQWWETSLFTKW